MHNINPKCLRSALYARNPDPKINHERMDPAHKAQDVGKSTAIYVQNLDAFALH